MTEEEIKNTPELVDFMLDKCILADSRTKVFKRLKEVCDLAIKVLEQQTCEDAISRQAVEDAIANTIVNGEELGYAVAYDILSDLPSVAPKFTDAVSREAVLGLFAQNADATRPYSTVWEKVKALPSVNPQSKTGHWIRLYNGIFKCDQCGKQHGRGNYCPNCGAKMVKPQESEE